MREKRSKYWYGSVLNMIKHYPQIKTEQSDQAKMYCKAIEDSIRDISKTPNGDLKVKAIDLLYFKRTNTVNGAALKCYAGERTIKRWASEFVLMVGEKVGF